MPTDKDGFEIFSENEMPAARPRGARRGARRKYPWWEVERGDGFRFAPEVMEQSARAHASVMSRQTGYEFKVYRDVEGLLWCKRVDGIPRSDWPDMIDGKRPPKVKYAPVEGTPAAELPPSVTEIDDAFENRRHDDTGGVPKLVWGKDDEII